MYKYIVAGLTNQTVQANTNTWVTLDAYDVNAHYTSVCIPVSLLWVVCLIVPCMVCQQVADADVDDSEYVRSNVTRSNWYISGSYSSTDRILFHLSNLYLWVSSQPFYLIHPWPALSQQEECCGTHHIGMGSKIQTSVLLNTCVGSCNGVSAWWDCPCFRGDVTSNWVTPTVSVLGNVHIHSC